jgi:cellulose biosynthesis protein BcsQ
MADPAIRRARADAVAGRDVIDASTVIVCCGSGGVGKTTTAAVLGLEAARRGRRAVVVTIDPARRLADALGLETGWPPSRSASTSTSSDRRRSASCGR